jgi:hypothetical protein
VLHRWTVQRLRKVTAVENSTGGVNVISTHFRCRAARVSHLHEGDLIVGRHILEAVDGDDMAVALAHLHTSL